MTLNNTALDFLNETDPVIMSIILRELQRQREHLELIASENFASLAVLAAQGSILTNKYAEGLPQKRYYGGCEWIDKIEQIAIDRAKELFGASHVNVQPHSGAQANFAVFLSLLNPGDKIMGMDLSHGGHLTHGSPVNVSGKWFKTCHYGVEMHSEQLDYDHILKLAQKEKPKLIICGFSAYPRTIEFEKFRIIADEVGAYLMADIAHIAGLVASGHHPNPLSYCDIVTTTTHKTLRGPRGGLIMTNNVDLGKKVDKAVFPGTQGGPLEHVIAAKAVAFKEALHPEFKIYSGKVINNAKSLANQLIKRGFRIVSNGTDNHLVLVDLRSVKMSGKEADKLTSAINITANKNTIPFDPESPFITSGLRLGSPAMTTRGLGTEEFIEIGNIIADRLLNPEDELIKHNCFHRVETLCNKFPLYFHLSI
ncbi:MAG: serine hydroxymethyltransferase [Candidatus Atelocyanobacterium thalassa isolate SIO64986]|uniref:Serine hydroxymethyltransferase n=1 Tax=Candidatus Atelocyanobacterium thalassa isolate SIO64986 TaxID=1527444 RepID=A0A086CFN2_9CHRO|nr:MAG: serine hydroxymethyltransferase [Candidatus Atelocyanobacterium thalassa isolate SIO64986]